MDSKTMIPYQNIKEVGLEYCRLSNGKAGHADGYDYTVSPGFFYSRNFIDGPADNMQKVINEIKQGVGEGRPSMTTFTAEVMPEGTAELFLENGFKHFFIQTGMVFDPEIPIDKTEDPHIVRISEDELPVWVDTMLKGFAEEGKNASDVDYRYFMKNPDFYFLGYKEEGKLLGTLILQLSDSYSGIHEVAVPPEHRGNGISRKLVKRALQIIDETGRTGAALQASPMGRPVYESVGFRKVSDVHTLFLPG